MNLPSLIPEPYRLLAQLAAVALLATALVAFGWAKGTDHVQTKWDAEKGRALAAQVIAEQDARAREQSFISQIRKAENDANDREEKRRAAVSAAADSDSRLQLALNTIRHGLPGDTDAACRAAADTTARLFGECVSEYRKMAQGAAGYGSAAQTLIEGWPKQ